MFSTLSNFIAGQEWMMIIIPIIILAVIGFIAVIKSISKRVPIGDKKRLDLLKDRLAKGEITKEEYDKLKGEFE
ncbi:SHOCT domain-containing protein [Nitrosopumilus ureiphilus]|nr:SHOCT domain-containing protein [Nitrosopumilus ureiphilus]